MLSAIDPGYAANIAAVGTAIGAVAGAVALVLRRRTETQTLIITGFEKLNLANVAHITALEGDVKNLETEVRHLRAEVRRSNQHTIECERELRVTRRRLAALESGNGSTRP